MDLKQLLAQIKETCIGCEDCDPCCTRNILKKCIENGRVISREAGVYAIDPAPSYSTAA